MKRLYVYIYKNDNLKLERLIFASSKKTADQINDAWFSSEKFEFSAINNLTKKVLKQFEKHLLNKSNEEIEQAQLRLTTMRG